MSEKTTVLKLSPFFSDNSDSEAKPGSNETVSNFVLESMKEAEQSTSGIVGIQSVPTLPPRSMLGMLIYCYTKGVLSSEEIERKLWKQSPGACHDTIPTARTIRRFRRLNRQLIQSCLEKTLRKVRRMLIQTTISQQLSSEGNTKANPVLPLTTPAPGEGTTLLIRKEVVHRIENAAILDSTIEDG